MDITSTDQKGQEESETTDFEAVQTNSADASGLLCPEDADFGGLRVRPRELIR
jgi:hypothetical protein